jgi:hypothetical protein
MPGTIGPRNWVLGKDLTALNLYSGSRDSTGLVTYSAYASMLAMADYIRIGDERMLDMIAPVNAMYAHYEQTLLDSSLVVGEILSKFGTQPGDSYLAEFAQLYSYIGCVFVRGGREYTYLGIIQGYNDGVTAYGKNAGEMSCKPIDNGVPPLTYSLPGAGPLD